MNVKKKEESITSLCSFFFLHPVFELIVAKGITSERSVLGVTVSVPVICCLPLDVFVRRLCVWEQICASFSVQVDLLSARAYLADETCCCDTQDGIRVSPGAIVAAAPVVGT